MILGGGPLAGLSDVHYVHMPQLLRRLKGLGALDILHSNKSPANVACRYHLKEDSKTEAPQGCPFSTTAPSTKTAPGNCRCGPSIDHQPLSDCLSAAVGDLASPCSRRDSDGMYDGTPKSPDRPLLPPPHRAVLKNSFFFCKGPPLRTAPRDHQPPTANRQPPTANRQPPTAHRQPPPTANHCGGMLLWCCVLSMS